MGISPRGNSHIVNEVKINYQNQDGQNINNVTISHFVNCSV